jgi:sugar/nucleoside kinase (ribokinase family)
MRVLGIGYSTLDQIGLVERFPEPDFKVEMSTFSVQGGGTAATAMVVLARWGVPGRFIGKVGSDDRGEQIVRTLHHEGIDTTAIVREQERISQLSFIIVEAGTGRKQTYFTWGNVGDLHPEEVDLSLLDGVELLVVDGYYPKAQLLLMKAARERGIPVLFEGNGARLEARELVAHCDYIVTSERFASQFTGVGKLESVCRTMLEKGPSRVVVTLGDEGAVAMSADDGALIRVEAHPADVVDRTGAGDVFLGAFAYGILAGWSFDKQVRVANAAAGLSCAQLGGRGPLPGVADLELAVSE